MERTEKMKLPSEILKERHRARIRSNYRLKVGIPLHAEIWEFRAGNEVQNKKRNKYGHDRTSQ